MHRKDSQLNRNYMSTNCVGSFATPIWENNFLFSRDIFKSPRWA
jgi:hypothetical protein